MIQPLLVIDCHYMCHRAFYAQRDLSFQGVATGVIYGFLKSLAPLKNQFMTDRIAFCFETPGSLLRRDLFPDYKRKREQEKKKPEVQKARKELNRQIELLQTSYLPEIGFRNIFHYPGYESDDIMAVLAQTQEKNVILVTSDMDMLQCLRSNRVSIYSPHQNMIYTEATFWAKYGIRPKQWALVKALAGCSTDGVPGIGRVGEATALKMIKEQQHLVSTILTSAQWKRASLNYRLVELPFSDCPTPVLKKDRLSRSGWDSVCKALGARSLVGRTPLYSPGPTLI